MVQILVRNEAHASPQFPGCFATTCHSNKKSHAQLNTVPSQHKPTPCRLSTTKPVPSQHKTNTVPSQHKTITLVPNDTPSHTGSFPTTKVGRLPQRQTLVTAPIPQTISIKKFKKTKLRYEKHLTSAHDRGHGCLNSFTKLCRGCTLYPHVMNFSHYRTHVDQTRPTKESSLQGFSVTNP